MRGCYREWRRYKCVYCYIPQSVCEICVLPVRNSPNASVIAMLSIPPPSSLLQRPHTHTRSDQPTSAACYFVILSSQFVHVRLLRVLNKDQSINQSFCRHKCSQPQSTIVYDKAVMFSPLPVCFSASWLF